MFTRPLAVPARSFLLLGPRGTGKTTWLRQVLPALLNEVHDALTVAPRRWRRRFCTNWPLAEC